MANEMKVPKIAEPLEKGWLKTVLNDIAKADPQRRIAALEAENARLLSANELDRRELHGIVRAIDEEITGRLWLLEGRGCYEWDDDRYRQEFGWAVKAIQEKLEPLRKIASDLKNCPTNEQGVERVRKLERVEQERDALKAQVNKMFAALVQVTEICEDGDTGAPFGRVVDAMNRCAEVIADCVSKRMDHLIAARASAGKEQP